MRCGYRQCAGLSGTWCASATTVIEAATVIEAMR
ncbi:MAG: hypothetical protein QOG37_2203, partial [Mycobacterium sp.]|nr:hypothetical protein [Mycobacterium sp.]